MEVKLIILKYIEDLFAMSLEYLVHCANKETHLGDRVVPLQCHREIAISKLRIGLFGEVYE